MLSPGYAPYYINLYNILTAASRSSWRRPIEQATSVTSLRTSSDHDVQVEENSFHQHKLVCSNFRLNLYAHEK